MLRIAVLTIAMLACSKTPTPSDEGSLGVVTLTENSSQVTEASREVIERTVAWQRANADGVLIVEGQRTELVRDALVRAGADPARLVLVSGANRRVVIRAGTGYAHLTTPEEQRGPVPDEQRGPVPDPQPRQARRAPEPAQAPAAPAPGPTIVIVPG